MQLYAFDEKNSLVFSSYAQKQHNYYCPECRGTVRLRGGLHRQNHFYHLQTERTCHLNGKSMAHLQVQLHLLHLLPEGECQLECRFPEIGRIADVAWFPKKIIFEVQCSFISAEEVRGRIQDYRRQGWTVVWILHDRRYNQSRLTAAEWVLRSHPTYFTNIDEEGQGCIYDQFDYYQQGWRQSTLSPLPVSLAEPRFLTVRSKQSLRLLNERIQAWPLYFKGDLLDQGIEGKGNYLEKALEIEQGLFVSQHCSIWYRIKNRCHRLFIRPYLLLLQMWLENACR